MYRTAFFTEKPQRLIRFMSQISSEIYRSESFLFPISICDLLAINFRENFATEFMQLLPVWSFSRLPSFMSSSLSSSSISSSSSFVSTLSSHPSNLFTSQNTSFTGVSGFLTNSCSYLRRRSKCLFSNCSRQSLVCLDTPSEQSSKFFPDGSRAQPSRRSISRQTPLRPGHVSGIVVFMAVANEFSIADLYRQIIRTDLRNSVRASPTGTVLRLERVPSTPNVLSEAFAFPYGCLVVWGSDDDCEFFLSLVIRHADRPRTIPAVDTMQFRYGTDGKIRRDTITLTADASKLTSDMLEDSDVLLPELERLAISCGLAQSVKLGAFETSMRTVIENTRHLPEQLAASGQITASQRDVTRLMGRLFLDRYRYHLSGDLLVAPPFFWDNEQYLPCYYRIERYLEIRERGDVLNKRVEVVQELYKLLGDEISNQNSMALELAITTMIAFEILLTLVTLAKDSLHIVFIGCTLFSALSLLMWILWRLYRRRQSFQTMRAFRSKKME